MLADERKDAHLKSIEQPAQQCGRQCHPLAEPGNAARRRLHDKNF